MGPKGKPSHAQAQLGDFPDQAEPTMFQSVGNSQKNYAPLERKGRGGGGNFHCKLLL